MAKYMFLLRGGDEALIEYTPEQIQAAIQPYIDWERKLSDEGRLHDGKELEAGGNTLRWNGSGFVVDGPFTETKESIGGYFIISAEDDSEAIEIAKGCPIFSHEGVVEVRKIIEQ